MADLTKDDVILALIDKAGFDEAVVTVLKGVWTGSSDRNLIAQEQAAANKALAEATARVKKVEADAKVAQDARDAANAAEKAAADAKTAADAADAAAATADATLAADPA